MNFYTYSIASDFSSSSIINSIIKH